MVNNSYILDTDTVSLLERGDKVITARIASQVRQQIATSVITVEEQMQGRLHRIREAKTRGSLLRAYHLLAETTQAL